MEPVLKVKHLPNFCAQALAAVGEGGRKSLDVGYGENLFLFFSRFNSLFFGFLLPLCLLCNKLDNLVQVNVLNSSVSMD